VKKKNVLIFALVLMLGSILIAQSVVAGVEKGKVPITTSSKKAHELYLKGRDLAESLQLQESREYFEKAVQEDPDFAMGYLQLAFAQPSARAFFETLDKAVAHADKVSEGERLWILGVQAGVTAFPMKQRSFYKKLVAAFPGDERVHNLLGTNYFG